MGLAEYLHSCLLEKGTRFQPSAVRTACQRAGARHMTALEFPKLTGMAGKQISYLGKVLSSHPLRSGCV